MNNWPHITELDEAWERINALGGRHGEYDDFGRGINHAIDQALAIIEELGGSDPAPKRARTKETIDRWAKLHGDTMDALRRAND